MGDVDRLLTAFEAGRLVRPAPDTPNSVDVALAVATLAGIDAGLTHGARRIASLVGESQHLVFVLVDGLGANFIERLSGDSFLRSHLRLQLQTVFPSTTVAALTSLATGVWPAEHGVPTWWAYLPDFDMSATVLPFIERFSKRSLSKWGIESSDIFTVPSLAARVSRDVRFFMPSTIASSVYTGYSSGGAAVTRYTTLAGAVDAVLEWIRRARDAPTYSYLYYPRVDAFAHVYGPDHALVRAEVQHVDKEIGRLANGLDGLVKIVLTADHGLVEIPEEGRHSIDREHELMALLLAPPSGEPRVPLFHVQEGSHEEFERCFRARFGERFGLLKTAEVEELALLGPNEISDISRARLGDYLAIALEDDVLVYEPDEWMIGFHAGLTPQEMLVPLIVA